MTSIAVSTRRALDPAVRAGIKDIVPILVGVTPFGMTIGASIAESSFSHLAGWLGGPMIAAGSAHLATVTLAGTGMSAAAVVVTALIINARLAAYSAALAPAFGRQPRWFRWLAPAVLVDQTFALAITHQHEEPRWLRRYYLAAISLLMLTWVTAITVGMAAGPVIPSSWQLWLAIPLMFCGMTIPAIKDRASLTGAVTGGAAALALSGLPAGAGLVAAIVVGTVAGTVVGGRSDA